MPLINFETMPFKIGNWAIVRIPENESAKLPSRGQVVVEGTINNYPFKLPLEPDGKGGHWFKLDDSLVKLAGIKNGGKVNLSVNPSSDWPEPIVPPDLKKALKAAPNEYKIWHDITPMARWEWIRWIRSTNKDETRKRRVEVAISKLKSGKRRPCCWNRNLSTEPLVSKNGVLLIPAKRTD